MKKVLGLLAVMVFGFVLVGCGGNYFALSDAVLVFEENGFSVENDERVADWISNNGSNDGVMLASELGQFTMFEFRNERDARNFVQNQTERAEEMMAEDENIISVVLPTQNRNLIINSGDEDVLELFLSLD